MFANNAFSNSVTNLTLTKIVSAQVVKYLWKASFTLHDIMFDDEWDSRLTDHREKVIRTSNTFIEENGLPLNFKPILKESIFSLFHGYYKVIVWQSSYSILDSFNLSQVSELNVQNYFNIYGEFNDMMCAKHIVNNSKYDLCERFALACLYCFENESEALWKELKRKDLDFIGGPLYDIRICIIENRLQDLAQYAGYEGNVWEFGLKFQAECRHYHATYYFWNKLSETQRLDIMKSNSFFELLDQFELYGDKITYFLYSQLSKDRKQNLLDLMVAYGITDIWINLSCFWHIETIRCELIEYAHKLPIETIIEIINLIAIRIEEIKIPNDVQIFKILWIKLTPNMKASLKERIQVIEGLVQEKLFDLMEYIIKSLTLKKKKKYLLRDWHGMKCIDILCKEKDFEMLKKYISFFLIKIDTLTKKESLRKDASSLLQKLVKSPNFRTLCEKNLSEAEETQVRNIIETLQISLDLLDALCNNVSEKDGTLRNLESP